MILIESMLTPIKNSNKIIAASIDIGSNSIRLLIAEVHNRKISKILYQEKTSTRLAAGIDNTGALSEEAVNKTLEVLKHYKQKIDEYNVDKVKAVATSAVRESSNKDEFISRACSIGIDINIISGKQEGIMEFIGVSSCIDVDNSSVILDIGGGSTELIYRKHNLLDITSIPIGVVRLTEQFDFRHDTRKSVERCNCVIKDFFNNTNFPIDVNQLIVTAGTPTTIAAINLNMKEYNWEKINGHKIFKYRILEILNLMIDTPYEKRSFITGMDQGREDLIIPGILILLYIMDKVDMDYIVVSDFSLREGAVVLAAYE